MTSKSVVLVVEDEPLLRLDAADMIERAGFEVLEAANATEAITILQNRLDVRIVFSDIDMPLGIDGMKLAAIIRERWPPIEIILVSGHIDAAGVKLPPRSLFFSKPYKEADVIGAIRRFAA